MISFGIFVYFLAIERFKAAGAAWDAARRPKSGPVHDKVLDLMEKYDAVRDRYMRLQRQARKRKPQVQGLPGLPRRWRGNLKGPVDDLQGPVLDGKSFVAHLSRCICFTIHI